MTRNLKTLGLALVAAFAMSAVAASAASAQEQGQLTTGGQEVTFTGTESTPNFLTFPAGGGAYDKIECVDTYTGHKFGATPHQQIPDKATTVTITPHYAQPCLSTTAGGSKFPATVTMNGCDYEAHIGTTTPAGNKNHTYGVEIFIVCPPNKQIEVHSYSGGSHGFSVCTTTVPAQGPLKGAHVTGITTADPKNHDLQLAGTITGIKASKHGLCGSAETQNATYDLDVTVKAHNALGQNVPITVTDTA